MYNGSLYEVCSVSGRRFNVTKNHYILPSKSPLQNHEKRHLKIDSVTNRESSGYKVAK